MLLHFDICVICWDCYQLHLLISLLFKITFLFRIEYILLLWLMFYSLQQHNVLVYCCLLEVLDLLLYPSKGYMYPKGYFCCRVYMQNNDLVVKKEKDVQCEADLKAKTSSFYHCHSKRQQYINYSRIGMFGMKNVLELCFY